jgi:hypothetical protein
MELLRKDKGAFARGVIEKYREKLADIESFLS